MAVRMVHTNRPLQEKMTLFWHNRFATAYGKLAGQVGAEDATRYLAAKPSEDRGGVRGQIEMLRDNALGNFRDMLVNIAQDTAMLYWLDGFQNVRASRRRTSAARSWAVTLRVTDSNGAPNCTEADVYAAARVFTGWNLTRGANGAQQFCIAPTSTTSTPRRSFSIYPDGGRTIPARAATPAACRTASRLHRRPGQASSHRSPSGHQAVSLLHLGNRTGKPKLGRTHRHHLSASQLRHEGGDALGAAVA